MSETAKQVRAARDAAETDAAEIEAAAEFMRALAASGEVARCAPRDAADAELSRRAHLVWLEARVRRAASEERRAMLPIRIWSWTCVLALTVAAGATLAWFTETLPRAFAHAAAFGTTLTDARFAFADSTQLAPILLVALVCLCALNLGLLRPRAVNPADRES